MFSERAKGILGFKIYDKGEAMPSPFSKKDKPLQYNVAQSVRKLGTTGLSGIDSMAKVGDTVIMETTVINTSKELKTVIDKGFSIEGLTEREIKEGADRLVSAVNMAIVKPFLGSGKSPEEIHLALRRQVSISTIQKARAAFRAASDHYR